MTNTPAHWESLPGETKQALAALEQAPFLKGFYLAGGTGLALWLGHRISVDLDFFSETQFSEEAVLEELSEQGTFRLEKRDPGTIHGTLGDVKVAFLRYAYPLLEPLSSSGGVAVASAADIACMKLDAIASRGTKRDFIDIYFVLQHGFSLRELLERYREKYARLNVNLLHVKKSLVYFDDADPEPEPRLLRPVSWDAVKAHFRQETARV